MSSSTTAAEYLSYAGLELAKALDIPYTMREQLALTAFLDAYARERVEAARLDWSCPLCHCCGEKRHDGDDPCVSCQTAVEAFREKAKQICEQYDECQDCRTHEILAEKIGNLEV